MTKIIIKKLEVKLNKKRAPLPERFSRYVVLDDSDCWNWNAATNEKGYGLIGLGTRSQGIAKAHRVSYELFHYCKLKPDQCVCHICDNPPCVNPHHLFIGSNLDNIRDMVAKGRNKLPPVLKGEESVQSKLTNQKVKEIRKLSKLGFSMRKMARMFDVSKSTISRVVNNKGWRHV